VKISANQTITFDPAAVRLTGNVSNLGHQVAVGGLDVIAYLSPAEMSELGHRFIELAAQAEERERGPLAVA
jgi:hypothetical protein